MKYKISIRPNGSVTVIAAVPQGKRIRHVGTSHLGTGDVRIDVMRALGATIEEVNKVTGSERNTADLPGGER